MTPLSLSDARAMARVHAAAFVSPQAWSEQDLHALIHQPNCRAYGRFERHQNLIGFILVQLSPDAADILTLAVHPDWQGQGCGSDLLKASETQPEILACGRWTLDVAADNTGAIAFYKRLGFLPDGVRKNYYRRGPDTRIDAILMSRILAGH